VSSEIPRKVRKDIHCYAVKKSKLKKRLRKKLRVGEFQEFGFKINAKLKSNLNEADFDKFYDEFIEEIELNKLAFGGGGSEDGVQGFITSQRNYHSPTEAQREKIKRWFESRPEVAECEVGNFKDAWYDV
jgi:uncharacterized protein